MITPAVTVIIFRKYLISEMMEGSVKGYIMNVQELMKRIKFSKEAKEYVLSGKDLGIGVGAFWKRGLDICQ